MSDSDLYTDADPEYRRTKLRSGIPPPGTEATRAQEEPPRPCMRYAKTPVKPDMRVSTDFLTCERRLSVKDIVSALRIGKAETHVDDWSSAELASQVLSLRTEISKATPERLSLARARSNPFEAIGRAGFMNRAATKLAALDATFGLTYTPHYGPLLFADLCGGPGGFSEYILWRIYSGGGTAKGFGMTLVSDEEPVNWQLQKFRPDAPTENFTVINGVDGKGDLYNNENIKDLGYRIQTDTGLVDLVVADGGLDFSGQEDKQERLASRLILCEVIAMLSCLKGGGTFVCKFFDIHEEFTANIVWLLYQLFEGICITKPLSSRPANSERYIVCKDLQVEKPVEIINTLMMVNEEMATRPVESFVKRSVYVNDDAFIDYVKMRNIRMATKQLQALQDLNAFLLEPDRQPVYDQEAIKRQCLAEWRLPFN